MIILRRASGFLVFSIAVQFLFWMAKIDIFDDLNIFGEVRCWPWLLGALVIFLLVEWLTHRCRMELVKRVVGVAFLAALLALGWFLPRSLSRDGLAVGINQFLSTYWILNVAVFWLGLRSVIVMMKRSTRRWFAPDCKPTPPGKNPNTNP